MVRRRRRRRGDLVERRDADHDVDAMVAQRLGREAGRPPDAFIWMVIDAYKTHPVVQSSVVKGDTESFLEDAGDDLTLVRGVFKVTRDVRDFVLLADVNRWGKLNGMSKTKLHDRLARMGGVKDSDCCVDGVRHGRGFMMLKMEEGDEWDA